ncbi:MFS transporter [Halobacillus litoralis]|uniref:MFS transporter n=1 Tax=Halobacillus litoralis TaxID=45668 RepID=A0A845DWM1_9BACI|nr:MFS transporter [Halobacillus litoralis]MYL20865.1 MFS transporter [Halobacillus litoralis]
MEKTKQPIWTKNFISVSLTHFFVFVTFYALLTTLPIYVIDELGGNEAQGGLVVTAIMVAAILIRPFSGRFLEKTGKKKGLIAAVSLYMMTMIFYLTISQFEGLMVLRFIHGLSFAVVTTATGAIAADVVPAQRRGEGLGYFAMSMNVAVVVGPFVGLSILQAAAFETLFIVLSVFMLLGVISSLMIRSSGEKAVPKTEQKAAKVSFHDLFETRALSTALIASLVAFSYSSIVSFISVYANSLGLGGVSSYFFVVFAVVMIVSRPSLGRAFDRKGPSIVILPSLLLFAGGLILLGYIDSLWGMLLAGAIIGLGYGSLLPSFQTMAVQSAPEHRSGHATATFFMMYDTGIAAGSYVLGLLVSMTSFRVTYQISGMIVLLVLGIFYYAYTRQQKTQMVKERAEEF